MRVVPIACLSDNYAYLVICEETREAAVVDASEAAPVLAAVEREGVTLVSIWTTHHHFDHVGGNEDVAKAFALREVTAHVSDRGRVPGQTRELAEGDVVTVGSVRARALHVPGHTLGAVAYFVDDAKAPAVFTGDTMFLAGCGRLFEGTAAQMFASFAKLGALPSATRVYCGHEYTASNLKFAAHVDPKNDAVARAMKDVAAQRADGKPTVPGTIGREHEISPFLRAKDADAFAAVRRAKDEFKS